MKHLLMWSILLAACTTGFSQATASTNQTISVKELATLELDLRSKGIEIKATKGSRIIVESYVTLETINNNSILEYLIKAGRYNLVTNLDAGSKTLSIQRKVNTNLLIIKGQECVENIRYVVLVPDSIKTIKKNGVTTPIE